MQCNAISHTDISTKISFSKEEKNSIIMSIGKSDVGTTESHGETRRQRLHFQRRSSKLHNGNGKRVGAHDFLRHLRNGGDFGFVEGIPENRRGCRQDIHSQYTSLQYSLFTSEERTRNVAQELHRHLCAPEECLVMMSIISSFSSLLDPVDPIGRFRVGRIPNSHLFADGKGKRQEALQG